LKSNTKPVQGNLYGGKSNRENLRLCADVIAKKARTKPVFPMQFE